jgi:hypothetical protein
MSCHLCARVRSFPCPFPVHLFIPFPLSLPQGRPPSLRLRETLGGHVKQRGTSCESDDSFIFQFPASLGGFSSHVLGAGCVSMVADGHVGIAARDACHNHSA